MRVSTALAPSPAGPACREKPACSALQRANELLALPPVAINTTRLAGKAQLIEALSSSGDTAAATAWWFSAETQAEMHKLVARLTKN